MTIAQLIVSYIVKFIVPFAAILLVFLILLAISLPFIIRKLYPIIFITFKNAGGGEKGQVTLYKKVFRRGRIINTEYGQRVRILGIKDSQPLTIVSRDNAIPWEAGGVAFLIYEKEIGQFFPVKNKLKFIELMQQGKKEDQAKVKEIYELITREFPDIAGYVRLVDKTPSKVLNPVLFTNHPLELKPVPVDMITQFAYDMLARRNRLQKKSWLERYGTIVVGALMLVTIITIAVLSYDQITKSGQFYAEQAKAAANSFGEQLAQTLGKGETPPGGAAGILIPFIKWRRRGKVKERRRPLSWPW